MNFKKIKSICDLGLHIQFIRFAAAGLTATSIQYILLIYLVEACRIDYIVSSTLSYFFSAVSNYLINCLFTFKSTAKRHKSAFKFFSVSVFGLIINGFIMSILINILNIKYLISQILVTSVILLFNFIFVKYWAFKDREPILSKSLGND